MEIERSESRRWFERAAEVVPGGIYGHASPILTVPGAFPAFARSGRGPRFTDVDGNEYIDFMCGYGPVILGHGHPRVDAAAAEARTRGSCLNHPATVMVELAERLVDEVDFASWAVFAKNGSDLTTWCVRVARERTGRPLVLKIRGAYHGMHAWCSPAGGGLTPEDRTHVRELPWNDPDALEQAFRGSRDRVAALILTPFHHPAFGDSELPAPEFAAAANRLCRETGALLIMDDVRGGLRLSDLGSHGVFGFQPDLAVYGKALANGHAISAAVGRAEHKPAASRVFLTGTFWNDPAPMAAALETLDVARETSLHATLEQRGRQFVEGLEALGRKHTVQLRASGPPAMPYVRVAADPSFRRTQALCTAALAHGVFLHPHHNWFLCAAHSEEVIEEALARLEPAFARFAADDPIAAHPGEV